MWNPFKRKEKIISQKVIVSNYAQGQAAEELASWLDINVEIEIGIPPKPFRSYESEAGFYTFNLDSMLGDTVRGFDCPNTQNAHWKGNDGYFQLDGVNYNSVKRKGKVLHIDIIAPTTLSNSSKKSNDYVMGYVLAFHQLGLKFKPVFSIDMKQYVMPLKLQVSLEGKEANEVWVTNIISKYSITRD